MIPQRYRLLWFALTGAMLGGSVTLSFYLIGWFNDPLAHFLEAIRAGWLFADSFIWFGIIWGLVHGVYRGLEEISKDPFVVGGNLRTARIFQICSIGAGLISFLMVFGHTLWEYHNWRFGFPQTGWFRYGFGDYYLGLSCFLFSAMGLTLARQHWFRFLFFLLTVFVTLWISRNSYFPWQIWPQN
jgi:hypothetical protein